MGLYSLGLEFFPTQGSMTILAIIVFACVLIDMSRCSLAGHCLLLLGCLEAAINDE